MYYETGFVNKSIRLCETLENKKQFSIENFNKGKTIANKNSGTKSCYQTN